MIARLDVEIDEIIKAYEIEITMLQTIPGVAKKNATSYLSESEADMSKFLNEKHLSSWQLLIQETMNLRR